MNILKTLIFRHSKSIAPEILINDKQIMSIDDIQSNNSIFIKKYTCDCGATITTIEDITFHALNSKHDKGYAYIKEINQYICCSCGDRFDKECDIISHKFCAHSCL